MLAAENFEVPVVRMFEDAAHHLVELIIRELRVFRSDSLTGAYCELLAIWDGKSRGTANMIEEAKKRGLFVQVHYV